MSNDWNGNNIEVGRSKGGVIAVSHPYENLLRGDIKLWPPHEIIQKMYQSKQAKSFENENYEIVTKKLKYYCDLQSIHSEDAITWNVFGLIKYSDKVTRVKFVNELLGNIGMGNSNASDAEIWLWRRIPHPNTLVPGGPEIDFGILSNNTVILGEAKWLSGVGKKQGKGKNKDQIDLRIEYLKKYGNIVFQNADNFIVLELGFRPEIVSRHNAPQSIVQLKNISWERICGFKSHPFQEELTNYYNWKKKHSKMK